MKKLLIVCGPTGTGKTSIAVALAKKFNGELISADSRQVYREMDIATGKDRDATIGVPVWLYDVVGPDEAFSVSQYRTLALDAIEKITNRNMLPIVVGGTGLYIKSLLTPMDTVSVPPNAELRKSFAGKTVTQLQHILEEVDTTTWKSLNASDRFNPRRLIRKIEIAQNQKQGTLASNAHSEEQFESYLIGLTAPFVELYKRIDARVDARVSQGVEEEVQRLLAKGYSWDLPSMNTFGYKEWKDTAREDAIKQWKFDEHAYARRQMTWFKKQSGIHWYDVTKGDWRGQVEADVSSWYTQT